MHYIVVENNQLIGIMPYEPAVPAGSTVVEITDEQYASIYSTKTHVFNPITLTVELKSQLVLDAEALSEAQRATNMASRQFLDNSDWKVMRHIREKALGQPTSLTDAEYLDLEQSRAEAAAAIVEIQ